ncbi:polysaccharide deacetylase family protein [Jiangella ureilytica]|uniref:polysaccharide deacetylase family protein n=1 Tax=Jiangella ureilytica TaxID=2530374 RepID=UPI0013A5E9A9|nr:polysaccharide deacetylase family protein [Jiangella ureilytica]
MNNLSWPATILIGLFIGLIAVAAERSGEDGDDPTASPSSTASPGDGSGDGSGGSGSDDDGGGSGSGSGAGSGDSSGDGSGDSSGDGAPDTGGDPADYTVTLTFDDGPHPVYTPQILDLLEKHEATAVFCMVGERVREHPEVVRQVVDAGHALCNHTFTHDEQLSERTREQIVREIGDTDEAFDDALGEEAEVRWFRQPNTYVQPPVESVLDDVGLEPLDWTVDPRDWSRPGVVPIVQQTLGRLEPGAIILLHDGGGDRSQTVTALEQVLTGLDAAGYQYVLPGDR